MIRRPLKLCVSRVLIARMGACGLAIGCVVLWIDGGGSATSSIWKVAGFGVRRWNALGIVEDERG